MNFSRLRNLLFTGISLFGACILPADPLRVSPGQTVRIGDPEQPSSQPFDSLTVESGGTLELLGQMTLNVTGDILIAGSITRHPKHKPDPARPGTDGRDGPSNTPTGLNAGTGGILGDRGADGAIGVAPRLSIRSQGQVVVSGSIDLRTQLDGGDGGQGGRGGHGGSGQAGGAGGGFGGQAGEGGSGGRALGGSYFEIRARRIVLEPTAEILLDAEGRGGQGAHGGDGGNGGAGGDGDNSGGGPGGGGGPAGPGGNGGEGHAGGTLYLIADSVLLDGNISLRGSPGGDGGDCGRPGNGGNAGDGDSFPGGFFPGGRGGDAGNINGSGPTGGDGGNGGRGGDVFIQARNEFRAWTQPLLTGGDGGKPGAGRLVAIAHGGDGGAGDPPGDPGFNSGRLLEGRPGNRGQDGTTHLWTGFSPGPFWSGGSGFGCTTNFLDRDLAGVERQGVALCANECLASSVLVGPQAPIELRLEHRWLTSGGALVVRLGDRPVLRIPGPASISSEFQTVREILTDPSLRSASFQRLEVCLESDGGRVQVANLVMRSAPEIEVLDLQTSGPPAPGGPIRFTWTGRAGQTYELQQRRSLTSGEWQTVGAPHAGTGAELTADLIPAAGDATSFVRVIATP